MKFFFFLFVFFKSETISQTASASCRFLCLVELWVASENFPLMRNKSFSPLSSFAFFSFLFLRVPYPLFLHSHYLSLSLAFYGMEICMYFLLACYPEALNCFREIKDILLCDAGINCFLLCSVYTPRHQMALTQNHSSVWGKEKKAEVNEWVSG